VKEIQRKNLSGEAFCVYGTYSDMVKPHGPHIGESPIEFYGDIVQSILGPVPVRNRHE
jgi:hypothetical protein